YEIQIVRRQLDRPLKFGSRAGKVEISKSQEEGMRAVRDREIRIQRQCGVNGGARHSKDLLCLSAREVVAVKRLGVTHLGVGPSITRVQRDRGLVGVNRLAKISLCVALKMELALKESVVSRETAAWRPVTLGRGLARVQQLCLKRIGDCRRDV